MGGAGLGVRGVQGRAPQGGSGRIGVGGPLSAEPGPSASLQLSLVPGAGAPGTHGRPRGPSSAARWLPRVTQRCASGRSRPVLQPTRLSGAQTRLPSLPEHPLSPNPSPRIPAFAGTPEGGALRADALCKPGPSGRRALVSPLPARLACSALS